MSFIDCITKAGDIAPAKKKELSKKYKAVEAMMLQKGAGADAALKAAMYVADAEREFIERRAMNAKRQPVITKQQFDKMSANYSKRKSQWDEATKKSPSMRLLSNNKLTGWLFLKPSMNREISELLIQTSNLGEAYKNMALDMMESALAHYKTTIVGNLPTAESRKAVEMIYRAAAGEQFDDAAIMQAGKDVRKAIDFLNDEYIAAGGVMNKLENWMPQIHNAGVIKAQGFDVWHASVKSKLDWTKIKDHVGYPIPVNEQDAFLREVYETLSTDGMNKRIKAGEEGKVISGGGGLANRRGHHRVLHFKTIADQLEYNKKFGTDDPFLAITYHMESMGRDVAMLKQLGPNPESFVKNIDSRMAGEGGINSFTQHMYDVAMGRTALTGSESNSYKFMKGTMAYLRAAQLGAAAIPAVSDSIYALKALELAGLPTTGVMKDYFSNLPAALPGLGESKLRQIQALNVHVFELTTGNLHHAVFEGDTLLKGGKTAMDKYVASGQNASSLVMRASMLSHMTGAIKDAVSVNVFGNVGIMQKMEWAKLPPDFVKFMEGASGMTEADWKIIQKAETVSVPGRDLPMVYPSKVAQVEAPGAMDAAIKYDAFVSRLRQMAANEPDLRTKAVTTQGQEAGSASRAVWDMLFMYRSFPITMCNNHFRASLTDSYLKGGGATAAADMAAFIGFTTAAGYFVLNAKDVINNREPRVMRGVTPLDAEQAMLQGGSLSVFGDLLLQDYTRFGQSFGMAVAGPVVSLANDSYKLLRGDALDAMWGEDVLNFNEGGSQGERLGINTSKFVQRYMPGASLWQIRGILDSTIFDSAERTMGGNLYYEQKAREARNMRKLEQQKLIE
jgi:hypothetical protein